MKKKHSDMTHADYEGWEETTRKCLECPAILTYSYPYALCDTCQATKSCPHGTPYTECCNKCDTDSDFAYDAWREKR